MISFEQATTFVRRHGAGIAVEGLVNFVLPLLVFDWVKPGHGEVQALMASSIPPILWSLIEFARRRRVDAVSMLVLAGIALSLLAFLGGGSVKLLQLREKLVTVLIGLVFLGSVAIGKPLIYQLARAGMARRASPELQEFESLRDNPYFRRSMTVMTLAWGFGLVGEAVVSGVLVFTVQVHTYLIVGPVLGYTVTGGLSLWTFWYSQTQRRKGRARRAAALAEAQARDVRNISLTGGAR